MATIARVTGTYGLEGKDHSRGVLMAVWLLGCDLGLKVVARMASCDGADPFGTLFADPGTCSPTPLLGDALALQPTTHGGLPLGLAAGSVTGLGAQMLGLALLFLAVAATILVLRWRYAAEGDPTALAAIWVGALSGALPRLVGGAGQGELALASLSFGIGDLALCWGVLWIGWRALAEWRA